MEVRHASLNQVLLGKGGKAYGVTDDLLEVVKQLQEIDPRLGVEYKERGGYFAVIGKEPDGREWLVTTSEDLGSHLVEHVRYLFSHHYNAGREVEARDFQAARDADHAFAEKIGEAAEHLQHALRKDLQHK